MSENPPLRDRTAIVGIAQTEFSKHLEPSEKALACQVILGALEDAGIDPSEVDGFSSYTMEATDATEVAKSIGSHGLTHFSQIAYGGGAGPGVVAQLAMAVATGQCQVGVAWRSRKRGSGVRPWASGMYAQPSASAAFTRPYGLCPPVDEVAMLMRRYMHESGATREHLCNVAMTVRKMANNNPNAIMYEKPMTRDDYMNARWISEPLCLFDNCLETDGALACVVVSAERARDCKQRPAYIHSVAQGMSAQGHTMTNFWCDDPLRGPSFNAAELLFRNSDFKPDDLDCAQLYDAFTPLILLSLEGYGFCERGEGGAFTENGNIDIGGSLPINTSGGGLSEAYVHGFNLILEGVRQIRGTSPNQVENCESTLVTAGEAVPTSALILRK